MFDRRRRHEVEDALAAVALDDGGVATDFVEDLRTKPDVTDGAESVAGFGERLALAAVRNAVVTVSSDNNSG